MKLQNKFQLIAVGFLFLAITIIDACKKQPANSSSKASNIQDVSKPTSETETKQQAVEKDAPVKENKEKENIQKVGNNDKIATEIPERLLVSFYSIGGGIDVKSAESFDRFILSYKTSEGKSISYERVPWGREGELDYCVLFNGMSASTIEAFIESAKAKVSDCKMVHFKPNGECKRKR
jgi:hypothetical protein